MIANAVSTTGCAAMTPFNFRIWFRIMTSGINNTAFLKSVMVSDHLRKYGAVPRGCELLYLLP